MIILKKFSNMIFLSFCYEQSSYERCVAQLGKADALGENFLQARLIAINDFLTFITN